MGQPTGLTVNRQTLDSNKELVRAFLARVFVGWPVYIHDAVPDLDAEIEHLVADGDLVALHVTFSGTNSWTVELGDRTLPPSGGQLSVRHVHISRVADGRICEHWAVRDDLTLFRQLGVFQG